MCEDCGTRILNRLAAPDSMDFRSNRNNAVKPGRKKQRPTGTGIAPVSVFNLIPANQWPQKRAKSA